MRSNKEPRVHLQRQTTKRLLFDVNQSGAETRLPAWRARRARGPSPRRAAADAALSLVRLSDPRLFKLMRALDIIPLWKKDVLILT